MREPVRFAAAVGALRGAGARSFVELGPDGSLSAMGAQVTGEDQAVAWLPALRRDRDEEQCLLSAVAGVHVRGHAVDWAAFWAGTGARRVELPTYAFQRQRYWPRPSVAAGDVAAAGLAAAGHPLLGAAVELPGSGGVVLTGRLSLAAQPWLADHVVAGRVLVPGTAFVELAVRAGDEAGCPVVEELVHRGAAGAARRGAVQVQVRSPPPAVTGGGRCRSTPGQRPPPGLGQARVRGARAGGGRHAGRGRGPGGVAAGGRGSGGPERVLRGAGRGRVRVRAGVPRAAGGVAARRRGVRRGGLAGRR